MLRNFFIIANPVSGRKNAKKALSQLESKLIDEGYAFQTFFTPSSDGLSGRIKKNIPADTTDVVVIGGDGTLNATANAIHDLDLILNIVPAGTGNDFVKNLNLGSSLSEWIDTVIHGQSKSIDVGQCNGQIFLNGVGLGFDGQIVHDNLFTKSILSGHAKYYSHVLRILGSFKPKKISYRLDGGDKRQENLILLVIMNGTTFGGGFRLNPDAQVDDGHLDICAIEDIHPLKRFLNVGRLSFGTHGVLKAVNFNRAKNILVEGNSTIHAHIDGEYLGHPPYDIRISEKALKVRVKH